jgi:hypothetical protein
VGGFEQLHQQPLGGKGVVWEVVSGGWGVWNCFTSSLWEAGAGRPFFCEKQTPKDAAFSD